MTEKDMDAKHIIAFLGSMGEHDMAQEVMTMNNRLEAFASGLDGRCIDVAIAAEREACAKVCDPTDDPTKPHDAVAYGVRQRLAAKIRARSNVELTGARAQTAPKP